MDQIPIPIASAPGIQRDGTSLDGNEYIDGQWVRFQRGKPRKMGGYRSITSTIEEIIRGMSVYPSNGFQYMHLGSRSKLTQLITNTLGQFSGQYDRTPAGFADNVANLWQFDIFFDSVGPEANQIIAHGAPNLLDIGSEIEVPIYRGDADTNGVLTDSGMDPQSGGVLVLAPYLLTFGNNGRVDASNVNDPTATNGTAYVGTGTKIVKGLPVRGTGSGPSGLLWSLDALIRATFADAAESMPFAFDVISAESSLLSSQGVIEYDGIYYWPGVDRFLMFNGVVREVPNLLNQNYFFDNVNMAQRQKVFAFKVPRFGEILWCYPRGSATECTHAVIFNVRENTWYDTALPGMGRSAGVFAKVLSKPFMVDVDLTATGYTLWQHETGVDEVKGVDVNAIPSWFETHEISPVIDGKPMNKSLQVARIEPDFIQTGNLKLTVRGRANAKAPVINSQIFDIVDGTAVEAQQQTTPLLENRRLLSFKFESNVAGGDYQMGKCLAHVQPTDGRITS